MASKIRRVKECPRTLQRWIRLVNSVPADFRFDELFDEFPELSKQREPIKPGDLLESLRKKLPFSKAPAFYRYLKSELSKCGPSSSLLWSGIVSEIAEARMWLRMIARRGKAAVAYSAETGVDISDAFADWYVWMNPDSTENQVLQEEYFLEPSLNKAGQLTVDLPGFVIATIGVEALRIKECPICGSIFWAGRKEKSACSDVCTNRWWVRQNYAVQKANRERRKKLKARKAAKR